MPGRHRLDVKVGRFSHGKPRKRDLIRDWVPPRPKVKLETADMALMSNAGTEFEEEVRLKVVEALRKGEGHHPSLRKLHWYAKQVRSTMTFDCKLELTLEVHRRK
jgi:hypothetical protein